MVVVVGRRPAGRGRRRRPPDHRAPRRARRRRRAGLARRRVAVTGRLVVLASGSGSNLQALIDADRRRPPRCRDRRRLRESSARLRPNPSRRRRNPAGLRAAASVPRRGTTTTGPAARPTTGIWPSASPPTGPTRSCARGGCICSRAPSSTGLPARSSTSIRPCPASSPALTRSTMRGRPMSTRGLDRTGVMVHLVPDEGVDDGPVLRSGEVRDPARRHDRGSSRNGSTRSNTSCSSGGGRSGRPPMSADRAAGCRRSGWPVPASARSRPRSCPSPSAPRRRSARAPTPQWWRAGPRARGRRGPPGRRELRQRLLRRRAGHRRRGAGRTPSSRRVGARAAPSGEAGGDRWRSPSPASSVPCWRSSSGPSCSSSVRCAWSPVGPTRVAPGPTAISASARCSSSSSSGWSPRSARPTCCSSGSTALAVLEQRHRRSVGDRADGDQQPPRHPRRHRRRQADAGRAARRSPNPQAFAASTWARSSWRGRRGRHSGPEPSGRSPRRRRPGSPSARCGPERRARH